LATIVSLYSLFADPHAIPERVALLVGVVPTSIIDLIKGEIQSLAEKNISTLSTAFLIRKLGHGTIWDKCPTMSQMSHTALE
jgi:membrane protein